MNGCCLRMINALLVDYLANNDNNNNNNVLALFYLCFDCFLFGGVDNCLMALLGGDFFLLSLLKYNLAFVIWLVKRWL